jgi:hypothetical protein
VTPIVISLLACGVMLAGAAAGVGLRRALPDHHLNDHARDIVRLGAGLVGTMAALVLGLLINSASSSYEAQRSDVRQIAADLILLDAVLSQYGPQTIPIRRSLRAGAAEMVEQVWNGRSGEALRPSFDVETSGARIYAAIHALEAETGAQRAIQAQALQTAVQLSRTRLMVYERSKAGLPLPLPAVLLFWLTALFASYCLFSPVNATAATALVLVALSASAALFLILEMEEPFSGLLQVSSNAIRTALPPLAP